MLDFITINEHSSIRIDEGKIIYSDPYNISGIKWPFITYLADKQIIL